MGPDFSVNGYSFDLNDDEFDLESILREYENYDPNAPAPAPKGKVTITQEEKEAVNAFLQTRDVVTYTRLGVVFGLLKG